MAKSPDAFRTISEVADWLEVPTHVLRFWESRFTQVKPVKRAGGRRYYRPADMELLGGIKRLLHDDGMTIRGVQKILREGGVRRVADLAPPLITDPTRADAPDQTEPRDTDPVAPPVASLDQPADLFPDEGGSASVPDGDVPPLADPADTPLPGPDSASVPDDNSASIPDDNSPSLPDDDLTSIPKDGDPTWVHTERAPVVDGPRARDRPGSESQSPPVGGDTAPSIDPAAGASGPHALDPDRPIEPEDPTAQSAVPGTPGPTDQPTMPPFDESAIPAGDTPLTRLAGLERARLAAHAEDLRPIIDRARRLARSMDGSDA